MDSESPQSLNSGQVSSAEGETAAATTTTSNLQKLAFVVKGLDGSNSPTKTSYGARPPVRNFLRPSLVSKFSGLGRVFSTQQGGSSNSNSVASTTVAATVEKNSTTTESEPTGPFRSNSGQMSSTFVSSTADPSPSIKLQIRRHPEPETSKGHDNNNHEEDEDDDDDEEDNDSSSSITNSSEEPSPRYSDINAEEESSPGSGNNTNNNSYVSSADEVSPIRPPPVVVLTKTIIPPQLQQPKPPSVTSSVIRQLHPEFLRQVEKQVNDNVVKIDINDDDNAATTTTPSLHNNKNNHSNEISITCDEEEEEDGEMDEEDEVDDESNSGSTNLTSDNSQSRDNTITIMIGDEGVISETGDPAAPASPKKKMDDSASRRTKRKRKPTKPFMPDLVIPRLKIRRKQDEVQSSSSTTSSNQISSSVGAFSIETVDIKKPPPPPPPVVDGNTSAEVSPIKKRGRPRGSVNRVKTEVKQQKTPGRRGRPPGSKNKTKLEAQQALQEASTAQSTDNSVATTNGIKIEPTTSDEIVSPSVGSGNESISGAPITPGRKPRGARRGPRIKKEASETLEPRKPRQKKEKPENLMEPKKPRQKKEKPENQTPTVPKKPRQKKEKKEKVLKPKKPKEIKAQITAPPVQVFEEETRMSADIKAPAVATTDVIVAQDEESVGASNMSSTSTSATGTGAMKAKKFTKDLIPDRKPVTAETLFEYRWPQTDDHGEMYMLQEQASEFLGVKSFKRKYPDLRRRMVDMQERDFLRSMKIVSETQCDLGLTALSSSDVLDIMFNDFPEKYEEFSRMLQERKEKELVRNKIPTAASAPIVRDRTAEYYRRCLKSASKWNAALNRQRKEERSCSFDLQTFTLHYPKGKMKVLPTEATKVGYYPVAVLPGQYCDNYKSFTPAELKYLPLNTVLYGPVMPQQALEKLIQNESDDDSMSSSSTSSSSSGDSSSDDSSSSSDDEVSEDPPPSGPRFTGLSPYGLTTPSVEERIVCKSCEGDHTKNKLGQPEVLLHCTKCDVPNHPSCLELRADMLPFIKKYNWQCTDCKNCIECNDPADEDKMLFCDACDRGYHIYCVGLRKVPVGRWHCQVCSVCHSCGTTQPSPDDRLAEWHHEFRKGEKNTRHYVHSMCQSCHKLYKKGQYCPTCLKVHLRLDDKNLSECRNCEKWVHKDCAARTSSKMFGFMCTNCDAAFRQRTKLPSHVN